MTNEIIELLKDDQEYYNGIGKKYLSNSDLSVLLNDPASFGKQQKDNLAFLQGRYFHTSILEPHKLEQFQIIDSSTRTTNKYKDAVGDSEDAILLLEKEAWELNQMASAIRNNNDVRTLVFDDRLGVEIPHIGTINNIPFKCKVDIEKNNCIVDLKTTSSLDEFKWNAKKYGYNSQAYIYKLLTGRDMVFVVVEKKTNRLGVFDCSDEFYRTGEERLLKALEIYDKFFGTNSYADIEQYYINQTLF